MYLLLLSQLACGHHLLRYTLVNILFLHFILFYCQSHWFLVLYRYVYAHTYLCAVTSALLYLNVGNTLPNLLGIMNGLHLNISSCSYWMTWLKKSFTMFRFLQKQRVRLQRPQHIEKWKDNFNCLI